MATDPVPMPDPLAGLFEDFLNGQLDDSRTAELESRLLADVEGRRAFVRYVRMHMDLVTELRARQASDRVLSLIDRASPAASPPVARRWFARRALAVLATAVALLLAVGIGGRLFGPRAAGPGEEAVAWLVNAQNCTWADGEAPGELRTGRSVRIDRGLAEIHFRCGARVVIEGPAQLDLVSDRSVALRQGKLTVRVPTEAIGFEVRSPEGKVIDLGTEFGVAVAANGATDVYVFEGKVEAHPPAGDKVNLTERQAARFAAGRVIRGDAEPKRFIRAIVPMPEVALRTTRLTFGGPVNGTLHDRTGVGTGLTHRLPGTGEALAADDDFLRLDPKNGRLELTATRSDLNGRYRLPGGEYLGLRLSDVGFTGPEDFEVSAVFPEIPALNFIGQFGLYAGSRSDHAIRGGVIKLRKDGNEIYTQFLVSNATGKDSDLYEVGLLQPGTDLRLTLRRAGGKYTLTVENLTAGGSSTLAIKHPEYLDPERDLYVGLFAAEPRSDIGRKIQVSELRATVWAASPAGR